MKKKSPGQPPRPAAPPMPPKLKAGENVPRGESKKKSFLEISEVPFEVVASIAATLSTQKTHPIEAIERAYDFLQCAKAAQEGNRNGISVRKAVLEDLEQRFLKIYLPSIKGKIQPSYADDDLGGKNPLPVDFKKAFTEVIGTSKKVKAGQKVILFRHFVMELMRIDFIEAGELIAKWKKEGGIPWKVFKEFRDNFDDFKKLHDSRVKSESGKLGRGIPRKRKPRISKAADPKIRKFLEAGREIARNENSPS